MLWPGYPPPMEILMTPFRAVLCLVPLLVCLAARGSPPSAPDESPPPHRSVMLESVALKETRRINVYVPPGQPPGQPLPVIYMPDGGVAEDFPHIANTIDAAIRAGRMAPVMLVGIENTQRRRDMTGPTEVEDDRKIAPVVGGSAAFRAFIADELMQWVTANYATTGQRGIIGESLAGLFIVETFFTMPELFDTCIALDPSLWWNAGTLSKESAAWLAGHPDMRGRLYVAWAEPETIGPNVALLEAALQQAAPQGLEWQIVARPDLDHATIYRAVAPVVLPAMYPPRPQ